jgi:hypothetical protein
MQKTATFHGLATSWRCSPPRVKAASLALYAGYLYALPATNLFPDTLDHAVPLRKPAGTVVHSELSTITSVPIFSSASPQHNRHYGVGLRRVAVGTASSIAMIHGTTQRCYVPSPVARLRSCSQLRSPSRRARKATFNLTGGWPRASLRSGVWTGLLRLTSMGLDLISRTLLIVGASLCEATPCRQG